MPEAKYWPSKCRSKLAAAHGFVTYWLFLSVVHCIFMIYLWTANSMSWRGLYLLERREWGDEREEQKQENGLIDLIWILLSAVRVMMMMWVPVRIRAQSHTATQCIRLKHWKKLAAAASIKKNMQRFDDSEFVFSICHWFICLFICWFMNAQPSADMHSCTIK